MPFRPSCIICCSDCDADSLFTSCQHFLCARCTARYPPGQCPRCRKPCKVVKAGAALPNELQERMAQDPQRVLAVAAQALEFQRRQEHQTLQRLREIVTTLNQSNRSMASQLSAAKTERESLLNKIKRLQDRLYAQQQQQQQMTQRPVDSQMVGDNGGVAYGVSGLGMTARVPPSFLQTSVVPSPTNAAVRGWLSSPAAAPRAMTPLGWSQPKRQRDDVHHTPGSSGNNNNHIGEDVAGAGCRDLARFRLATPAITLRNALPSMRDATPAHQMDRATAMSAPAELKSLLCRGP
ncbi:putative dynein heavy chain, cytosolic [Trypanosoma rangeli]|uniref:Putative dynein heavy chain, cytosolic n=1 Tax=Trypanosoma rangeli TaxID=5698 RepID=A0A422NPA6_TRYRA|nr:putative dynein heavy chain, cytosolic [Trypanosoma rangeli]RNF07219.1 putative dynein heavy chain, cytosolic [Trypanosoma rangeli]|eukprot:RNF07219.1 putative dynein heavy chain, cytosolic [Trypanosoma rangeli]